MSKDSDERYTPEWLLDIVREMGAIGLDPCAPLSNPVNAEAFCAVSGSFDRMGQMANDKDGLQARWTDIPDGLVWINPPYSAGAMEQWVHKTLQEASNQMEILMLTQADSSTRWHQRLDEECDARCALRTRVGFVDVDGNEMAGAKFASAVWYWGPRRRLFRDVWELHGKISQEWGPE